MDEEAARSEATEGRAAKKPSTLLGSLPWRDKFRIGLKALWTLCPTSLQGALAWAALGPLMLLGLRVMGTVDPVRYGVPWGGLDLTTALWIPALAVAAVFLPAVRGARAIRAGGLFPEYFKALRGQDPATGEPTQASLHDWSWFLSLWILSVGGSWLDERNLRSDGAAINHPLAWHAMNAARIEICVVIFLTLALAWLSKMGVLTAVAPELGQPAALPQPDWSKLRGVGSGSGAAAKLWWSKWKLRERARWNALRGEGGGFKAWSRWWGGAPFGLRVGAMSCAAIGLSWGVAYAVVAARDPIWVANIVSRMTWGKWAILWLLSSILIRLVSVRPGVVPKSDLWHGTRGPSAKAWAGLALAGAALDIYSAAKMDSGSLCSQNAVAGEGFFVAVLGWVFVVWGGDVLGWAGGYFARWGEEAHAIGGFAPLAFAKLFASKAKSSWAAASVARVQLAQAVERKAMENEVDLARSLRKELAESIPEAPRKSTRSNRL